MGETKAFQEIASTYFNSIVRKDVKPQTVEQLPSEVVASFNEKVRLAFPYEADTTVNRVKYLVPYILQAIDWNCYGIPLEEWQLKYYYRRDRFLEKTHLDYKSFLNHKPLQSAIEALHLEPEPTFEFIVFLKYYYGMRSELRYSPIEQLGLAQSALENLSEQASATIDISVAGKHFKITNAAFVKEALLSIDLEKLQRSVYKDNFSEGSNRDKIRALDYYIIKTLLDYLPTQTARTRGGKYTQEERNFGLSVLSYIGRLPDIDREGECSAENNATFDKLMRDFKSHPIPFAMELFL